MAAELAVASDYEALIALAGEVEELFGPMVAEASFREALRQAISEGTVFCARPGGDTRKGGLEGGIVISKASNEIAWFVVARECRGKGVGRRLLDFALARLDRGSRVAVQTFADSVPEGRAARALYSRAGFEDYEAGGVNPAGIPTVIMHLPASR